MAALFLRTIQILTALVLALGLFGCDSGESVPLTASPSPTPLPTVSSPVEGIPGEGGTFRIMSSLPHKGYAAQQSRQIEQAVAMRIGELPISDGLLIEYVPLDSSNDETGEWSPEKETANINRAVSDPRVVAYIGPYTSGATSLVLPIANKTGLLVASPSAGWPGLSLPGYNPGEPDSYYPSGKQNFVGMMPDDSLQGQAAAEWVSKVVTANITILNDGSTYSNGIAGTFSQTLSLSLRDMSPKSLTISPPSLDNLVASLGSATAIFYAPSSVNNAIAVARALENTTIDVFATDVALDQQFLEGAGNTASPWHIVSNSIPTDRLYDGANATPFRDNFRARYHSDPGQYALNAYNLASLITYAIPQDYSSMASGQPKLSYREGIVDYVRKADQPGAAGYLYFNYAGRPKVARMSGYEIIDGQFSLATIFTVSRP